MQVSVCERLNVRVGASVCVLFEFGKSTVACVPFDFR